MWVMNLLLCVAAEEGWWYVCILGVNYYIIGKACKNEYFLHCVYLKPSKKSINFKISS